MAKGWIAMTFGSGVLAAATASQPLPGDLLAMNSPAPAAVSASAPDLSAGPDLAPPSDAGHADAARAAIEDANRQWLAAFRSGDSATLARIYAPDASLFPPSDDSIEGRDRIVEYFGERRRAGLGDATIETTDVVCVGDVAYEVGSYRFRARSEDVAAAGDSGRYFTIWKSQPDGSWRYQVGIWSSNRDLASAARRQLPPLPTRQ